MLDNRKLIQWDTTVAIDPNSPLDAYGQPGETGGRTVRLAMGIRF